jgi:hypothetical protein
MLQVEPRETLMHAPLAHADEIDTWKAEGSPVISFPQGCMRLENSLDADAGQAANYVLWLPDQYPGDIQVSWDFRPIREPGLAMFWCRANGRDGRDLFDPALAKRDGRYRQYFDGDIDALHASYFRRKQADERRFHTCNLRKSKGFHLVCQGGDPIPSVGDVDGWYRIQVTLCGPVVQFAIDDLVVYEWRDDGVSYGPVNDRPGYIGFRQMAPLIAEYRNLLITSIRSVEN